MVSPDSGHRYWSMEWRTITQARRECVAAIRELIGESEDYPIVFDRATNYDDPEGPTFFRFHGAETPGGRLDKFEVEPARQLVLEAQLYTRVDERYNTMDSGHFLQSSADRDAAAQMAADLAIRHCPEIVTAIHLFTADFSSSPYIFRWQEIAAPWGVRLPRWLEIGIDGINGRFAWWTLELQEITADVSPRMTLGAVLSRAVKLGIARDRDLVEAYPPVIGEGRHQRIVWDVVYQTDPTPTVVIIDDVTGRVEGTL